MNSVALLTIISFISFMSNGVAGPISSLYLESLGASYFMLGVLSTVSSLTRVLSSYLSGRQSDRLANRKLFLAGGLAGSTLVSGGMAIIPSYLFAFPLRVVGTISRAAYNTSSLALMGDLLENRTDRGRRMGIYRGLGSLGFATMAFFAGSIADRTSLRVPMAGSAVLLAIALLLSLAVREASPKARARTSRVTRTDASPSAPTSRLPLTPLLVSVFLWALAFSAMQSVWSNYLVGQLNFSKTVMSRLWALAAFVEFPMMVLGGWLSDRLGRLPVLALGLLGWSVVYSCYVFFPVYPWIMLVQVGRGFSFGMFVGTSMTYATEVAEQSKRGRASGLYSSTRGLGSVLGGTVGGSLTQFLGFQFMLLTCATLVFGGAVYVATTYFRWRGTTAQRHDGQSS